MSPFIESHASPALITTTIVICVVGMGIPFTSVEAALGLTRLPPLYWPLVAGLFFCYAVLIHLTKAWLVSRWRI
jgi:Mg2+-importing ATPase